MLAVYNQLDDKGKKTFQEVSLKSKVLILWDCVEWLQAMLEGCLGLEHKVLLKDGGLTSHFWWKGADQIHPFVRMVAFLSIAYDAQMHTAESMGFDE